MPNSEPMKDFYDRALKDGSNDAQRVGWESSTLQKYRFETLLEALDPIDFAQGQVRLLDVGCGLGDLYGYLQATNRRVRYTGIDIHPEMIDRARRRYPEARFECVDFFDWPADPYEVVISSGGLSLKIDGGHGNWRMIEKMYQMARWVASFNIQCPSNQPEGLREDFWLVPPGKLYPRLRRITPRVAFREDAITSEAQIYLYRNYTRSVRSSFLIDATPEACAEVYLQQGRFSAALIALEGLQGAGGVQDKSDKGLTLHDTLRAVALSHLHSSEEALLLLQAAHVRCPEDYYAASNLINTLIAIEEFEAAEKVLWRVLEENLTDSPESRDQLREQLHSAYLDEGNLESANKILKTTETEYALYMMEASESLHIGQDDSAEAWFQQARNTHPWEAYPILMLADLALHHRRLKEAIVHSAHILSISPMHQQARQIAGQALHEIKEWSQEQKEPVKNTLIALQHHPVLGPVIRHHLRNEG